MRTKLLQVGIQAAEENRVLWVMKLENFPYLNFGEAVYIALRIDVFVRRFWRITLSANVDLLRTTASSFRSCRVVSVRFSRSAATPFILIVGINGKCILSQ